MGSVQGTPQRRDTTIESRADAVVAAFDRIPVPMALLDLPAMRIRAANHRLLELLGMGADQLIGWSALEFTPPDRREGVRLDQAAISEGRLEGFEAGRVFHFPGGRTLNATVWARRLVVEGQAWGLAVVLPEEEERGHTYPSFTANGVDVMMAVTNHDWVVERVSADARRVIGADAEDLVDKPLLGAVHPDDSPAFISSVAAAVASKATMVSSVRTRAGHGEWRDVVCFVTPLCAHAPPRLGLTMSAAPERSASPDQQRSDALEQAMWRIAMEVRAAGLLTDEPTVITKGSSLRAAQLSARQWEILHRLAQGQTAGAIASAMYLRPSTVRNHLAAIYRKVGVHSQVELLALVRDESPPSPS
jgi:PAS domain S-box-containing protein